MVVFLFKLIFLAISLISNFITRLIFMVIAYLFVAIIQGLKVPGDALVGGLLQQLGEAIKACFDYFLEFLMGAITSLISTIFNLLIEGLKNSAAVTGSAIVGLAGKTRESIDGLLKEIPELAGGFSDMVSTVVSDLWNNYKEAVGYVKENA